MDSKAEIRLIVLNLFFIFNLDFHFIFELSGGMGFSLALSIGEDCHSNKKLGTQGYCSAACQCSAASGPCNFVNECVAGLACADVGDE